MADRRIIAQCGQKYKNPPPKRKLQRGSVKSVMKKKGKRRGVLFPSQRRGTQYGSFRTLEGRNEEHSLHFEDFQHVFVVRFA